MASGVFSSKHYLSTTLFLSLFILMSGCTQAVNNYINLNELKQGLYDIATTLGTLMIVIQGIQWMLSTQPEEREECKKAIMYTIFALVLVSLAPTIVDALYCTRCIDPVTGAPCCT
ncbi:MAG: hypothetical protein FJY77_02505 [Candidatus Altiarchaeales archaeon]|nr:hypothetical protein [Candidatus Altiarchaeales archaeon]